MYISGWPPPDFPLSLKLQTWLRSISNAWPDRDLVGCGLSFSVLNTLLQQSMIFHFRVCMHFSYGFFDGKLVLYFETCLCLSPLRPLPVSTSLFKQSSKKNSSTSDSCMWTHSYLYTVLLQDSQFLCYRIHSCRTVREQESTLSVFKWTVRCGVAVKHIINKCGLSRNCSCCFVFVSFYQCTGK